jgi:hypothetical protein
LAKSIAKPSKSSKPAEQSASDAVSYISQEELVKLRGNNSATTTATTTTTTTANKSVTKLTGTKSSTASVSGAVVEYMSKEELEKLRRQSSVANVGDDDDDDDEEDDEDDEDDMERRKRRKMTSTKNASGSGSGSGSAFAGFMSKTELTKLRAHKKGERNSGGSHIKDTTASFETTSRHHEGGLMSDKKRIREERERSLDLQYFESDEKRWASIPVSERLPVDRAAPCLEYLLADFTAGDDDDVTDEI